MIYVTDFNIKEITSESITRLVTEIKGKFVFTNYEQLQQFESIMIRTWKVAFPDKELILENGTINCIESR